jgi:hypothetical protein
MKRGKPLQRRTRLERRTRIRARRPTERRSLRVRDRGGDRRRWTWRQPCCARKLPGHRCDGRVHAHHTGSHGTGQKPDDTAIVALCELAHQHAHSLKGCFRGFDRARMQEWEAAEVADHQARYERHLQRGAR